MLTVVSDNNQDVNFIFYHDDNGTTWDTTTLAYKGTVIKDSAEKELVDWYINDSAGSIGFEADDVDCVVNIWGVVYDLS